MNYRRERKVRKEWDPSCSMRSLPLKEAVVNVHDKFIRCSYSDAAFLTRVQDI